ncbi:MAG: radical SAM protein [Oligoflexia bacterium]|nr:radical SAM protein [Oligoflexia bacterium]
MTALSLISIDSNKRYYPYGLFCLYEYLIENTNSNIEICTFENLSSFISEATEKFQKSEYLGFSCYSWNVKDIKDAIDFSKKIYPYKKIIVGGPSAYEFVNVEKVDYVSLGAGEKNLKLLLEGKCNEKVLHNKISLNEKKYPFFNKHFLSIAKLHNYIPIEMSSGCGFQCAYCTQGVEKYGERPLADIQEELIYLKNNGVSHVNILDTTFNIDKKRFLHIVTLLKELGISWHAEVKIDIMDKKSIDALNCSTCTSLEIGLQSYSVETNKLINRRLDFEKFKNNLSEINSKKISVRVNTIIGLPNESFQDWMNSVLFLISNFNIEITSNTLRLYPDTKLYQNKIEYGYQYDIEKEYSIIQSKMMSNKEILLAEVVSKIIKYLWNRLDHAGRERVRDHVKNYFSCKFDRFIFFILKNIKNRNNNKLSDNINNLLLEYGVLK